MLNEKNPSLASRDVAKQAFLTAEKRDEWKNVLLCDICSREIGITTDARKGKIGECSWCAKRGGFVSPKAKFAAVAEKTAFVSRESRDAALKEEAEKRDEFLIEQLKASIIADLHLLQGQISRPATLKWLYDEFSSLPW